MPVTVLAAGGLDAEQLLAFWLQLTLLLVTARLLGGIARRLGQPSVVGELCAGLLLGPSLLGRLAPDVQAAIFPDDPVVVGAVAAVSWVGVALLLVVTGFETDLDLLRRLGRSSLAVTVGSLVVPLAMGALLGATLPAAFLGTDDRLPFVLFMAVAMSISSLPVIAKVLIDLGLMRRNIGQITIAAGMANDLIGWLLLGVVAGIAAGGLNATTMVTSIGGVAVFLAVAFTVGQRAVDAALRRVRERTAGNGSGGVLAVAVVTALVCGTITQAIGVEAVLGAFIAGILLGRSRYALREVEESVERVVSAFLAPLFFATAGLSVDLASVLTREAIGGAVAVIAVAAVSKVVGTLLGAWAGRLRLIEGMALAAGLNARGALEIIIATVGLGLGVLNQASYSAIVVMAILTSLAAGPLLRVFARRLDAGPDEAARLAREETLATSVIAQTTAALLPTRGGANSILAGRLLDLALLPDAAFTVLTVSPPGDPHGRDRVGGAALQLEAQFPHRRVDRIHRVDDDPVRAIVTEAGLGYGLVAVGMSEGMATAHALSTTLSDLLAGSPIPVLLVRHPLREVAPEDVRFRRVVVPATGTRQGRAAQEIAFTLADREQADVHVVHVVDRPEQPQSPAAVGAASADEQQAAPAAEGARRASGSALAAGVLEQARQLASRFGREPSLHTRHGVAAAEEIVRAADEQDADLIVLGASLRQSGTRPFLGHGAEYVLDHAHQTVALVVLPS